MNDPLAQVKQGARWLWSQGDYGRLAQLLEPASDSLARRCVHDGMRVLDTAAGNGNFAVAAARRGATVVATDVTPHMVALGGARTTTGGLAVEWREADAEELPFATGSFDLVASVFGAMFAPRPELVAREMFRVARPGGVVAMANYSPDGYLWRLSELIAKFSTRTDLVLPSPFLWGEEAELRRRFAEHAAEVEITHRTLRLEFASFDHWYESFATANPPLMAMKAILPAPAFDGLMSDAWALAGASPESPYLEVVATTLRG